jgi:hypothetical protein
MKDALGVHSGSDWRPGEVDKLTVRSHNVFGRALGEAGLGRLLWTLPEDSALAAMAIGD